VCIYRVRSTRKNRKKIVKKKGKPSQERQKRRNQETHIKENRDPKKKGKGKGWQRDGKNKRKGPQTPLKSDQKKKTKGKKPQKTQKKKFPTHRYKRVGGGPAVKEVSKKMGGNDKKRRRV